MTSILIFVVGAAVLVYSAEKLIGYLIGSAAALKLSLFLLAIIFTGIEFDDIALGVVLNLEKLSGVSLGLVFGTAVSFTGVVLALAAIIAPCEVNIPRDYLVIFGLSPLVLLAFVLTAPLTIVHGILLIVLFAVFVAYVALRESRRHTAVFRNAEIYEEMLEKDRIALIDGSGGSGDSGEPPRGGALRSMLPLAAPTRMSGKVLLLLAVVALIGLIVGAWVTGEGTEGILDEFGIEETLFGATIATAVLTLEDLLLTVEPTRRGAPELGVGNVIGSVVFSVTGKLGIILLFGGSILVDDEVLEWHLPVLIGMTVLAAGFLFTGRLRRWHGVVLLGLYVVYWVLSFVLLNQPPIESEGGEESESSEVVPAQPGGAPGVVDDD